MPVYIGNLEWPFGRKIKMAFFITTPIKKYWFFSAMILREKMPQWEPMDGVTSDEHPFQHIVSVPGDLMEGRLILDAVVTNFQQISEEEFNLYKKLHKS